MKKPKTTITTNVSLPAADLVTIALFMLQSGASGELTLGKIIRTAVQSFAAQVREQHGASVTIIERDKVLKVLDSLAPKRKRDIEWKENEV